MLNESGQQVMSFASALRNSSRMGTYADLVVEMFISKRWRAYETALGPVRWRAHEFDYFLIACDARYEDIVRILIWDTVRAAKLADAMSGPPSRERRTLAEVSTGWQSGTPQTLIDRAQTNGWFRKDRRQMKRAPVPNRALQRAKGTTNERLARTRRRRKLGTRREQLDRIIAYIRARTINPSEVAYIIDELRPRKSATRLRLIRSINP
jgi:hypothetical protein